MLVDAVRCSIKYQHNRTIQRLKAHFVAKGYMHTYGVDLFLFNLLLFGSSQSFWILILSVIMPAGHFNSTLTIPFYMTD